MMTEQFRMISNMITYSTYLLLEDRVDFLWNQYKDWYTQKYNVGELSGGELITRNSFDMWTESDPTPNKQYLQWIIQRLKSGGIRGLEDRERVKAALSLFHNNKQRLPVDKRDINKIRSLQDLEDLVEPFEGKVSNRQQEKLIKQEGAEVYYESDDWMVLKVTKPEAACYYGKNTKWCTGNIDTAHDYIKSDGFLLIFINKKNNRKYQATPDFEQLMDEKDRPVKISGLQNFSIDQFTEKYDSDVVFPIIFRNSRNINIDTNFFKDYVINVKMRGDEDKRGFRWPRGEKYLIKCFENILTYNATTVSVICRIISWYCHSAIDSKWEEFGKALGDLKIPTNVNAIKLLEITDLIMDLTDFKSRQYYDGMDKFILNNLDAFSKFASKIDQEEYIKNYKFEFNYNDYPTRQDQLNIMNIILTPLSYIHKTKGSENRWPEFEKLVNSDPKKYYFFKTVYEKFHSIGPWKK